jgi:hypothetical protein
MESHEVRDVALKVIAADARSLDARLSIGPDANGKVRVNRHNWKPISQQYGVPPPLVSAYCLS